MTVSSEELRKKIGKILKFWRSKEMTEMYYPLDEIMAHITAERDALLDRIEGEARTIDLPKGASIKAVPLSVIEAERSKHAST